MSNKQLVFFMFAWAGNFSVYADEAVIQRPSVKVVSYADVLQWLVALIIVLVIFTTFVWLLRKTGRFTSAGKNQLAVISGLSVGMREKLVLVKVGEKQLLLGVTPGRINKLLELEGDSRLFQNQESPPVGIETFAQKLQQVLQGKVDA